MGMRSNIFLVSTGAAILAVGGCAPVDPGFGEAVRYDMAIQTIDPDPVYPPGSLQPGYHGEKAQKASERYRKGTTKAIRRESPGGGSGGGTGGGSTPGS
jgi:hypothetical protein